jgi:hypothetical protein
MPKLSTHSSTCACYSQKVNLKMKHAARSRSNVSTVTFKSSSRKRNKLAPRVSAARTEIMHFEVTHSSKRPKGEDFEIYRHKTEVLLERALNVLGIICWRRMGKPHVSNNGSRHAKRRASLHEKTSSLTFAHSNERIVLRMGVKVAFCPRRAETPCLSRRDDTYLSPAAAHTF